MIMKFEKEIMQAGHQPENPRVPQNKPKRYRQSPLGGHTFNFQTLVVCCLVT